MVQSVSIIPENYGLLDHYKRLPLIRAAGKYGKKKSFYYALS